MIRTPLVEKQIGAENGFRWRGGEVTRIEGFSDGVFAFATTLLVVSLEVPHTFDELLTAMRGFAAFAVCFLMLVLVWYWHYKFFRRYGLQDNITITLNAILLFVVLFYVYPLKFMFSLVINGLLGFDVRVALPGGGTGDPIREAQIPLMFVIYAAGYTAIAVLFVVLHAYAYRRRTDLALDAGEAFATGTSIILYLVMAAISIASGLLAWFGGLAAGGWPGYIYLLLAPALTLTGMLRGRQQRALVEWAEDAGASRPVR